jgi:hypothetical protein
VPRFLATLRDTNLRQRPARKVLGVLTSIDGSGATAESERSGNG